MKRALLLTFALFAFVFAGTLAQAQATPKTREKSSAAAANKGAEKSESKAAPSEKLDINSATREQLEALPGIGPATSQKIIDGRPYRAKSDLVKKKIIGDKEYDKIKDQIIAHQAATSKMQKPLKPKK